MSFTALGPVNKIVLPVPGDYSWVNQGDATLTTTYGAMTIYADPDSGNNLRVQVKTAPSTPYVVEAAFIPTMMISQYQTAGLLFRESSTGKMVSFAVIGTGSHLYLTVTKWPDATSSGTDYTTRAMSSAVNIQPTWLKIEDNSTNLIFYYSNDGATWIQMYSVSRTDYMAGGANQVGFFALPRNATYPTYISLIHWEES